MTEGFKSGFDNFYGGGAAIPDEIKNNVPPSAEAKSAEENINTENQKTDQELKIGDSIQVEINGRIVKATFARKLDNGDAYFSYGDDNGRIVYASAPSAKVIIAKESEDSTEKVDQPAKDPEAIEEVPVSSNIDQSLVKPESAAIDKKTEEEKPITLEDGGSFIAESNGEKIQAKKTGINEDGSINYVYWDYSKNRAEFGKIDAEQFKALNYAQNAESTKAVSEAPALAETNGAEETPASAEAAGEPKISEEKNSDKKNEANGLTKEELAKVAEMERMGIEKEQAKAILEGMRKKDAEFGVRMEQKHGTLWGKVNSFFKKNYLARTLLSTAVGVAGGAMGGSANWVHALRLGVGAFLGKQGGEASWNKKNLNFNLEKDKNGNVNWAEVDKRLGEMAKTPEGQQQLLEMYAKGEVKFGEMGEKGMAINSLLMEKMLKEQEAKTGLARKAFDKIKSGWNSVPPAAKVGITLGVFLGISFVPGVNVVAGGIAAKLGVAKLGAMTGAAAVKYGMSGLVGGIFGALNSEKQLTKDTVNDAAVLERVYYQLCKDKSPEEMTKINQSIQQEVGKLEKAKGAAGIKGAVVAGAIAEGVSLLIMHQQHESAAQNAKASQSAAAGSASEAGRPTPGFDINKPGIPNSQWPSDPFARHFDINQPLDLGPSHHGAEVAANLNGSNNLTEELAKAGPHFGSAPHSGEKLVHHIIDGLQGKHQLDSDQPSKVADEMIARMKHEGLLNVDGSIKDMDKIKDLNPNNYTHEVTDHMGQIGAESYASIWQHDQAHNVPQPGTESHHEAATHTQPTHHIDRVAERSFAQNGFVESPVNPTENAQSLDQSQVGQLLDPKNKFFSEEVIATIKRVTDGDPQKLHLAVDPQGHWQIKFLVGDRMIGHEVWNNGQHQDIRNIISHNFAVATESAPAATSPEPTPVAQPSAPASPAAPEGKAIDMTIHPAGQQIDTTIHPDGQNIDMKVHPDSNATNGAGGGAEAANQTHYHVNEQTNFGQPISPEQANSIINPDHLSAQQLQDKLDSLKGPADVPSQFVQQARVSHPNWDATRIYFAYKNGLEMAKRTAEQTQR